MIFSEGMRAPGQMKSPSQVLYHRDPSLAPEQHVIGHIKATFGRLCACISSEPNSGNIDYVLKFLTYHNIFQLQITVQFLIIILCVVKTAAQHHSGDITI